MLKENMNDKLLSTREAADIVNSFATDTDKFVQQLKECIDGIYFTTKEENLRNIITAFFSMCGEKIEDNMKELNCISLSDNLYATKLKNHYYNVDSLKDRCYEITTDVLKNGNEALKRFISNINIDYLKPKFNAFEDLFYNKLNEIENDSLRLCVKTIKECKEKLKESDYFLYDIYGNRALYSDSDLVFEDGKQHFEFIAKRILNLLTEQEQKETGKTTIEEITKNDEYER